MFAKFSVNRICTVLQSTLYKGNTTTAAAVVTIVICIYICKRSKILTRVGLDPVIVYSRVQHNSPSAKLRLIVGL